MNTIKSVYYGWATLIVAGGGAYFFAKRSINADRAAKAEADRQKRIRQFQLEQSYQQNPNAAYTTTSSSSSSSKATAPRSVTSEVGRLRSEQSSSERRNANGGMDDDSNPSSQASQDPAPTRHAPEDEAQKEREKSKYEASDVYRSRKGDRFS